MNNNKDNSKDNSKDYMIEEGMDNIFNNHVNNQRKKWTPLNDPDDTDSHSKKKNNN